jgi:MFS family permease
VTSFAVGSAVSAVVAGRLVERYGRRLTVFGLSAVATGIAAAAVILLLSPPSVAGFAVAPALLLGGIGGGFVISPNITMTLRNVPVRMAGSAGGALQTGQRVGAAIGTAIVAGVYFGVLAGTGRNFHLAIAVALGVAVTTTLIALGIGIADLGNEKRRGSGDEVERDPRDGPPHHFLHE